MKRIVTVLNIFMLCCFSSCYELVEEVAVNQNGGGTMRVILNCSESKTKIAAAMLMGTFHESKIPDRATIQKSISRVQDELSAVPGISALEFTADYTTYIAVLKFRFTDITKINTAITTLASVYKLDRSHLPVYVFDKSSGIFEKKYNYAAAAQAAFRRQKQSIKDLVEDGRGISVCRFSGMVKSWSNSNARLLNSKSGIIQRFAVKDFVRGKIALSNKIILTH